jgi:L-fucose isomerase-like protein
MPRLEPLQKRPAPKVGLVLNSIEVFDRASKDHSEKAIREYFDVLLKSGQIDSQSIITKRIFGPHEAMAVADQLAAACVDLVVIVNIAFPNCQVFLTLATHPHLARVPLAVIAEPEPDTPEWATNAWCGVIMNNYVAHQINHPILTIPGPFASETFRSKFSKLLKVAGAMRFLRRDFLCRFGEAPGGFHSASGNQMAFAKIFGTRVDTLDLTLVMETFRNAKVTGYNGEAAFNEDDIRATVDQISKGRKIEVSREMLERGARLYQTYRAIVRANGYTSAAFRCWPEQMQSYIGVTSCMAIGLLLGNGDVTAATCESDWPIAIMQSIGTLLGDKPAACLDWVNYTGGSEIIQLGHCGVGICGGMAEGSCHGSSCDEVTVHPVLRLAGEQMGPVITGQYEFGAKTGLSLAPQPDGSVKILIFKGASNANTAKGIKYVAADVAVADHKKLNRMILEGGFSHHLAVAMADIGEETRMLFDFLGVPWVSPDA